MNLNEILTPETDKAWREYDGIRMTSTEMRLIMSRLERRLTIARTALEAITHDMHASQMIHDLCTQTLKLIKQ